jgi:hypothetical protein
MIAFICMHGEDRVGRDSRSGSFVLCNPPQRPALLGEKLETCIRIMAKKNQKEHGNTAPGRPQTLCPNSEKVIRPIHTLTEVSKIAHLSNDTLWKAKKIMAHGTEVLESMAISALINPLRYVVFFQFPVF